VYLPGYEHRTDTGETKVYVGDYAVISRTGSTRKVEYLLKDRLGSVDAVANSTGAITETRGYDAFGKPRDGSWNDLTPAKIASTDTTPKGFTQHEHLNQLELIHMNGRVYDYGLGRFTGVDPFVQFPLNSQSLNPYSYILNNPLSGTDPTGYASHGSICAVGTSGNANGCISGAGPDLPTGKEDKIQNLIKTPKREEGALGGNGAQAGKCTGIEERGSEKDRPEKKQTKPKNASATNSEAEFDPLPIKHDTAMYDVSGMISDWLDDAIYLGKLKAYNPPDPRLDDAVIAHLKKAGDFIVLLDTAFLPAAGLETGIGIRGATTTAVMQTDHIVLGKAAYGLDQVVQKFGGRHLMNDPFWSANLLKALKNPNVRFTISLDGIPGANVLARVSRAIEVGSARGSIMGHATEWEIAQVSQHGRLSAVDFVIDGKLVQNPF
jgi:RHS repeat-associated protein